MSIGNNVQFTARQSRLRSIAAYAVASLVLIAIIWSVEILLLRIERNNTIEDAYLQNSNLAVEFERHVIRGIETVDATAIALEREYRRLGTQANLAAYVAQEGIDNRLVTAISIIDRRGNVVADSRGRRTENTAGREYFAAHAKENSGRLFIGRPAPNQASGTWSIHMSRRINRADGGFGGVVAIEVDPNYFTNFYRQPEFGKRGELALIGVDGITRVRRTGQTVSFSPDTADHNLFRAYARSGSSSFLYAAPGGEFPRYANVRALADYPHMIMVGTSQQEVLAPYVQHARFVYSGTALASALIVLLAVLRTRHRRGATVRAGDEPTVSAFEAKADSTLRTVQVERRLPGHQTAADAAERRQAHGNRLYLAVDNRQSGPVHRELFDRRLDYALARAQRMRRIACVMLIRIECVDAGAVDGGHGKLHQHAAARLAKSVRNEDTIALFAEDVYAVILPQIASAADGGLVARKIINALQAPYDIDRQKIIATVIIGIATYPQHADNAVALIEKAAAAMSVANQQSVSGFQLYGSRDGGGSAVAA